MSSVMLSDLEPSNPFETLSDDPILHILSFLPGADLLTLATMDKNFKRIITKSTETMSKIRLVLDFYTHKDLDLDFAIKLAQSRRFTNLRLRQVCKLTEVKAKAKLVSLLELLSRSVDDLTAWEETSRELQTSIITTFLPKLKKCELEIVWFDAEGTPIEEISHQSNANHPLESLKLIRSHESEVLQLFTGCKQLKTFRYDPEEFVTADDIDTEHVNNFLAKQDHLEKLDYTDLAWNRLRCFKLKQLRADCMPDTDEQIAAAEFLKKLPNLRQLDIGIIDHPSRRLMKAISEIPKLEKLMVRSWKDEDDDDDGDSLERLVNRTVKELNVADITGITSELLKIFIGVESVYLALRTSVLDLSDVPNETIMKIKLNEDYFCGCFGVKFSPSDLPTNIEQFESTVMKFAIEFSTVIIGIKIGHKSWRNSGAFRVSNSFCENLVNQLPKLRAFEVHNIAERGSFFSFLGENGDRLNLEVVKLYKPNEAGEPKPKKMEIQTD